MSYILQTATLVTLGPRHLSWDFEAHSGSSLEMFICQPTVNYNQISWSEDEPLVLKTDFSATSGITYADVFAKLLTSCREQGYSAVHMLNVAIMERKTVHTFQNMMEKIALLPFTGDLSAKSSILAQRRLHSISGSSAFEPTYSSFDRMNA